MNDNGYLVINLILAVILIIWHFVFFVGLPTNQFHQKTIYATLCCCLAEIFFIRDFLYPLKTNVGLFCIDFVMLFFAYLYTKTFWVEFKVRYAKQKADKLAAELTKWNVEIEDKA